MNPGVYYDLPAEKYHASPGVSHSILKKMDPTPAHLKAFLDSREAFEPTTAMIIGTLTHHLVLEPQAPLPQIAIQPDTYEHPKDGVKDWNYNANVCKDWRRTQQTAGKIILKRGDWDITHGCIQSIIAHPTAGRLFAEGRSEVSVAVPFRMGKRSCMRRMRFDWLPPGNALVDIKTVAEGGAAPEVFSKTLFDFGYFTQAPYYLDGWNDLEFAPYCPPDWERKETFVFIVVEKAPPFAVAIYQVSTQAIEAGRRINHQRLVTLMECNETGVWPGYSTGIQPIDLPGWAYRKDQIFDFAA